MNRSLATSDTLQRTKIELIIRKHTTFFYELVSSLSLLLLESENSLTDFYLCSIFIVNTRYAVVFLHHSIEEVSLCTFPLANVYAADDHRLIMD